MYISAFHNMDAAAVAIGYLCGEPIKDQQYFAHSVYIAILHVECPQQFKRSQFFFEVDFFQSLFNIYFKKHLQYLSLFIIHEESLC